MRKLNYRYQRTLAEPAEVYGIGFLTGANVRVGFLPAPPDTGVQLVRTDLRSATPIPARVDQVTGTQRRTTLGRAPNQVTLVEHMLAALAGLRIDNCIIELNASEPPGMDGSAQPLVQALRTAGAVLQPARRAIWTVEEPVRITHQGASLAIYPSETEFKITYLLDYGLQSSLGRQMHTEMITPEHFSNNIAGCRTFILESEVSALQRQGLGSRTTAADLLVFGRRGPIDNAVRFADEPARHKVLDLVGDLSLFGHDIRGHVVAYRSGHPLNVQLARTLADLVPEGRMTTRLAA